MSYQNDEVAKPRICAEPSKYLPVAFVILNIMGLYAIYTTFHLYPLLLNASTEGVGIVEMIIFNYVTLLLIICYIRCYLTHPGTIPDKEVDPTWEYVPQGGQEQGALNLQETKRSGDRRHCKWCAKYKPDRTHHCRVCRTCILKMDHHCPWIYNCVGFRNHKFFFLLLFYSVIDLHLIAWTMLESVEQSVDTDTPFVRMFLLLFGETLAGFLGILLTAFFCFHIYLMFKAMTTIEFCEKQLKRSVYDSSVYDRGCFSNMKAVLGDNIFSWPFPICPPSGDGLQFIQEDTRMNREADVGRHKRRSAHGDGSQAERKRKSKRHPVAGTGSAPSSPNLSSASDNSDSGESIETLKDDWKKRAD